MCIEALEPQYTSLVYQNGKKSTDKLQIRLKEGKKEAVKLNSYEQQIACDLIDPSDLITGFDDIGGLAAEKSELYDLVVLPLKRPELYESQSDLVSVPKGILLYGVPGTGKTMLAQTIAKESSAFFINLKMGTIKNKWVGESEKLIAATFSLAKKLSPCIIFVDENL